MKNIFLVVAVLFSIFGLTANAQATDLQSFTGSVSKEKQFYMLTTDDGKIYILHDNTQFELLKTLIGSKVSLKGEPGVAKVGDYIREIESLKKVDGSSEVSESTPEESVESQTKEAPEKTEESDF